LHIRPVVQLSGAYLAVPKLFNFAQIAGLAQVYRSLSNKQLPDNAGFMSVSDHLS
jgi:hypothetical protein